LTLLVSDYLRLLNSWGWSPVDSKEIRIKTNNHVRWLLDHRHEPHGGFRRESPRFIPDHSSQPEYGSSHQLKAIDIGVALNYNSLGMGFVYGGREISRNLRSRMCCGWGGAKLVRAGSQFIEGEPSLCVRLSCVSQF
jgi:hypothetical protein